MRSECLIGEVYAFNKNGQPVGNRVTSTGIPLLVLLGIGWVGYASDKVAVAPVVSRSRLKAKAFVVKDKVTGVRQSGECKLRRVGTVIEGRTAAGQGHIGDKTKAGIPQAVLPRDLPAVDFSFLRRVDAGINIKISGVITARNSGNYLIDGINSGFVGVLGKNVVADVTV